jgi:hypothetical protein
MYKVNFNISKRYEENNIGSFIIIMKSLFSDLYNLILFNFTFFLKKSLEKNWINNKKYI